MPSDFNPTVFWIVAGMNDISRTQCSEEVTVIGILRLVEEILERKPNAQIVLNSLFPMLDLRGGVNPHHADMEDAYRNRPNRGHWWRGHNGETHGGHKNHIALDPKIIAEFRNKQAQQARNDRHGHDGGHRHLASSSSESSDDSSERQKQKKEPFNPQLKEGHVFRHRDPTTFFTRRRDPPLWPAVEAINNELKKFCQKHERVHFVDSTELFVLNAHIAHGDKRLNSELISWRGRPTMEGFEAWEDSIVEKVKYILSKQETKKSVEKAIEHTPSETVGQDEGDDKIGADAHDQTKDEDTVADDEADEDADEDEGDDDDADEDEDDDGDAVEDEDDNDDAD